MKSCLPLTARLLPPALQVQPPNHKLQAVQRESEVALDAISDFTLRLRVAEEARRAAVSQLAALEAELETKRAARALATSVSNRCPAASPFQQLTVIGSLPQPVQLGSQQSSLAIPAQTALPSTATLRYSFFTLACAALVLLGLCTGAAIEARRTAELAARLKEACFTRDAAERSVSLLEDELQKRKGPVDEEPQCADACKSAAEDLRTQNTYACSI